MEHAKWFPRYVFKNIGSEINVQSFLVEYHEMDTDSKYIFRVDCRCEYLLQEKGQEFVHQIQARFPRLFEQVSCSSSDDLPCRLKHPIFKTFFLFSF